VTFVGRLVAGTVAVLVLAVGVLVWSAERTLRRDLESDIARGLERAALLVREALPADSLGWQRAVVRLGDESGHRVTLIGRDGRLRADSDVRTGEIAAIENHAGRPEVRAALADGVGRARRKSATVGRELLYVAVAGGPGVIRVAAGLEQVDPIVRRAQGAVLGAAVLALVIGTLLAVVAGRSIAGPLTGITAAARAIAAGAPPRFPRSGIPDIDGLVQALRDMHRQLGERFDALRREQAESAALVEAMVEGVLAADARGRVVTANAAARRLLGYGPDDPLPDLRELFRIKAARDTVDLALGGTPVADRELELDGRVLLVNARPLPAGGAVLVLHDLTELRRLEAVRRDFVANVSHELKTPLTSISGYTETLLADDRPDDATAQRFLETIRNNARRMQQLVDDLLDLARLESGGWRPARESVDVAAVAHDAWAALGDRAARCGIRFDVAPAPDAAGVDADPLAFRQVLANLLDNSLRHTPPGGHVSVRSRRDDGGVTVSVSDDGAGIAREHLDRIFERFYRADPSRSREHGGTGLGLAIVKHLVEAHGGRVGAESEPRRGTTVSAWFPDAASRAPGANAVVTGV
jgi:two-component system phosphate regulon sensor histidine kinase PhoR